MDQSNSSNSIPNLVSDRSRAEARKYFVDFIDEIFEKYRDRTTKYDSGKGQGQSIAFLSEPHVMISKTTLGSLGGWSYNIQLSDDLTYNGISKMDSIFFELNGYGEQCVMKSVMVNISNNGERVFDDFTRTEAGIDDIKKIIKFIKNNETLMAEPHYDYFDNPRFDAVSVEIKEEEISSHIPEEETKMSPELNAKINEYIGSILVSMSGEELDYIVGHIKKEKQFSDQQIDELKGKLDYIKNERNYGFSESDLVRLNKMRAAIATDDGWHPVGTGFWRNEYPVSPRRSDKISILLELLYQSRYLFKEFIAGLMS